MLCSYSEVKYVILNMLLYVGIGVGISYSQQLRLLYPAAHQYLDKMVDWDRDSVCPDLYRIAYSLLQWDTLAPQLGLNHIDVEDIKQDYRTTKEQR